jgi:Electron transfer DM13
MNKKLLIYVGKMAIVVLLSGSYYLYTSRLAQSKKEGEKIVSRAIINPIKSDTSPAKISIPATNPQTISIPTKFGTFTSLDPAHYAKGTVILSQIGDNVQVNFNEDFETNPDGPDLYVWLVKKQDIKNIALGGISTDTKDYLDLGPLTAKSGAQTYQITKAQLGDKDYAVVIWCRAFGVQFSNAILK